MLRTIVALMGLFACTCPLLEKLYRPHACRPACCPQSAMSWKAYIAGVDGKSNMLVLQMTARGDDCTRQAEIAGSSQGSSIHKRK